MLKSIKHLPNYRILMSSPERSLSVTYGGCTRTLFVSSSGCEGTHKHHPPRGLQVWDSWGCTVHRGQPYLATKVIYIILWEASRCGIVQDDRLFVGWRVITWTFSAKRNRLSTTPVFVKTSHFVMHKSSKSVMLRINILLTWKIQVYCNLHVVQYAVYTYITYSF